MKVMMNRNNIFVMTKENSVSEHIGFMVYTSALCEFEKCKLVDLSLCSDEEEYMTRGPKNSL